MKELSLNILDIAENSVKAGATLTEILITETDEDLVLTITDNGCGMTAEILETVTNPFTTTRTTRKVGMGIPLLKLASEQCGGNLIIKSKHQSEFPENHGTVVKATFSKKHIDFTPLGDIVPTVFSLIQGHPETDFLFTHCIDSKKIMLDTREIKKTLGDVPINTYEVIKWIEEYLREQYL